MANESTPSTDAPKAAKPAKDPDAKVMYRNVSTVDQTLYQDQVAVTVLVGDTVMARPEDIAKLPRPWFQRVGA